MSGRANDELSALRVDLLSPCFWPEVRRGTERFVRELSDELLARGHRPRLITSHPELTARRGLEAGLGVVRVPRPPDSRLRRRFYEDYLTHVPFSYAVLRTGDAAIAHALAPPDALACARWKSQTGRPAILSHMGIPDRTSLVARRKRVAILRRVIPRLDAVVALSKASADAFARWLGVEARVIPPGVNLEAFQVGERRDPRPTIVCAADMGEPRKHVPLLLESFARVRRQRPDARLVLSRPRDPKLAHEIVRSQAGVELHDLDDRGTLARAYGEAWVSVLASTGEAFGLVLVEAMATGTPVVARAVDGMVEIVDRPSVGGLFSGEDPLGLDLAILAAFDLAGDPGTRGACRERAEHFSTGACAERYLELYREIL